MKRLSTTHVSLLISAVAAMLLSGPVRADWNPGDPHKMHFPQLPDPFGLDVNFMEPKVLADDWRCSATGPVSDIHFWFSSRNDQPFTIENIHVSIHSDIPATPTSHSMPGELLWARDFSSTQVTMRGPFTGQQGWYDPNLGTAGYIPNDHNLFFQINIEDILEPFTQELGKIYWLDLSLRGTGQLGWKTSRDHFNDDAVWADFPNPDWQELRHPVTQESLDLAFVITPEPTTLTLLGFASLLLLRRRQ